jgi:tetratricopeptide (TPR) repeat protein
MGLFSRTLSRLEELKKVLTRDPASRQFLALADEYRRQGQVKDAIAVLEQGLSQNPSAVAGHVALGRLLQQTGQVDSAIASFQAALRLDPQNLVALRQTADLYLSKGDKVEAIKKLKLFRGLSPGDREVNELIRQLDGELAALAAPRPEVRVPSGAFPAPPVQAPVFAFPEAPAPAASPEPPGLPPTGPQEDSPPPPEWPEVALAPPELPSEAPPAEAAAEAVDAAPVDPPDVPEASEGADAELPPVEEAPGPVARVPSPADVPTTTETLAELLRAQGHLGEAEQAYRELALSATDAERGRRLAAIADEISASRTGTARGRLEAWVEPFSRSRARREADLVGAVEEVVERLGASAAVVTDFEGVPVVSVGPRVESESMENLAAELTAFWKNARRSRAEIGEGALDSLVLSGASGTAAVKVITPGYALLLKTDPTIPAGRIRYEAARAAGQLRPALL